MKKSKMGVLSIIALLGSAACGDDGPEGNTNGNDAAVAVSCGNGELEALEQCDDGAANSDTVPNACRTNCTLPRCGDSVRDSGEECDEGPSNSDTAPDACRRDCTLPSCGDGVIDPRAGEQCDDGDDNSDAVDAHCRTSCALGGCGDGILDTGEQCDDASSNSNVEPNACRTSCLNAFCGDDVVDSAELCDDGNSESGDGCSADCQSDESCGNLLVDTAAGEECDDGNHLSHDRCSSGCTLESPVWIERPTATSPPERIRYALVYDSTRGRTLLFGGWTPSMNFADTWAYDGQNWANLAPASSPTARESTAMAYDPVRDRVVLFGGFTATGEVYRNDTWEFDGTTWVQRFPANSPTVRRSHAMAYDPVRGAVVFFGGENTTYPLVHGDTWEWNGTNWTRASEPDAAARHSHGMVWDVARNRLVMHGGIYLDPGGMPFSSELSDTWENSGTGWQRVTTNNPPGPRYSVAMAYDTIRSLVVLFSGHTTAADTWEYNGTDWLQVSPTASPIARNEFSMVFDTRRRRAIIFGGMPDDYLLGHLRDTWEYWEASPWPDEQCDNGADDDEDGEVDCADPDCEDQLCATGRCSGGACQ